MPSHDNALEEIKDRIDIVDLISEYVHLKKAGQNWKGLCPFHTEKTPSFTVSPAKQIFHCFGCGSGGDIFTFLTKYETLTFPEALSILAKKAGVTLKASQGPSVRAGEKEVLLNIHKDAAGFFRQNLMKNAKALNYLKARGIDDKACETFSIGYAPRSWNALLNYLSRKGYKPEAVKKAGLAVQGQKGVYDTFRDRILFPIYDLKGDAVAFGGRSIDGSEPKYLNSPETPIFNKRKVLYGLDRAKDTVKKGGNALFMEGYMDVITAHLHGFSNAVAPLGTALTPEHGKLIKRFTEEVVVVFDSDQAGVKAAKKAAGILLESGLGVKILSVPDNEDPDSFLREKGKDAFEKLLSSPLSIVDFFVRHGGQKHIVADEIFEVVSRMPNEILQEEYLTELSERIKVDEKRVRERFRKKLDKQRSGHKRQQPEAVVKPASRSAHEEYLIKLLLQVPEKVSDISGKLSAEDFKDDMLRGIFTKIKGGSAELNDLISQCEEEERDFLAKTSLEPGFEDTEKVFADCIRQIEKNKREILKKELQYKMKEAESRKDFALVKKLQTEMQQLLKKSAEA